MVVVRRAVAADWERSRDVRLRALQEAPLAFASTYEREVKFGQGEWQGRIVESAQFLAESSRGDVVGTATGFADPDAPGTVILVAMFVDPEARRQGIGELLVRAVVEQAEADRARRVVLQVVETNAAAERLYSRCGFTRTGATMTLPHRPELLEREMELRLPAGRPARSPARPVGDPG